MASEDKISSIIDFGALQKEKKEFEQFTKSLIETLNKIPKKRIEVDSASSAKEFTLANAKLQQEVKAVINLANQRFAADAKVIALQTDYAKATAAARLEIQKQNAELKTQAQLQAASSGSLERSRAAIKALKQEQEKLNLFTKEGQTRNIELNAAINKQNEFIRKNSDDLAKQKINVGNYSGAVNILKKSLEDVTASINKNTASGKANTDATKKLQQEEKILNELVNAQALGFAKGALEVRANEKALLDLSRAGLQGTKAFKELSLATGKLKDDLADVKARTKALGSDTFAFDAAIQGAQTLAGVYGVAQGAAALFGKENEDLAKAFVKLQAIQTVIAGLQSIQNALQKESAFILGLQAARTRALALATQVYSFFTAGATVATRALGVAVKSTGLLALLLLLPQIVSAMQAFGEETNKTANDTDKLTGSIDRNNDALDRQLSNLDKELVARKLINRIKLTGDQLDAKNNADDENIALLKKQKISEGLLQNEQSINKVLEARKKVLASGPLEKDRAADFDIFTESVDGAVKKIDENLKKLQDNRKKLLDDNIAAGTALTNIRLGQTGDRVQKEFKAESDASKRVQDKRKADNEKASAEALRRAEADRGAIFQILKDSAEERAQLAQKDSENEDLPLRGRLNALVDFNTEKQEILIAQKDFDLENTKLTEKQKEAIVNKFGIDSNAQLQAFNDARFQILKTAKEKEIQEFEDAINKTKALSESNLETDNFKTNQARTAALIQLEKDFAAGKIKTVEEYNTKKKAINDAADKEELGAKIKQALALLAIDSALGRNTDEDFKRLQALKAEYDAQELAGEESKAAKKIELATRVEQAKRDLAREAFETLKSLVADSFNAELQGLDNRKRLLDEDTARRINQINLLGLSEVERTRQIAIVQKEANFQNEQIEKRKRQIAQERARFEKAANIASIIGNTAKAVVASLPNIPLSILVGTIGLLQLTRAISTPIPKYKEGRGKGKEELAIVGDGGKHEYIMRGNGMIEQTPRTDTLTRLMPNDVVFKDQNALLNAMLASSNHGLIQKNIGTVKPSPGMKSLDKEILSELKEIKRRSGVSIVNNMPIESTAYYQHHIKN